MNQHNCVVATGAGYRVARENVAAEKHIGAQISLPTLMLVHS
jgi:hypothetical protein